MEFLYSTATELIFPVMLRFIETNVEMIYYLVRAESVTLAYKHRWCRLQQYTGCLMTNQRGQKIGVKKV